MATSAARIVANQKNAQLSTGPRTAAGKAVARLNAFQHGLAGAGDLLAPGEDEAQIDRRTAAFVRDLGATGETGHILARRAAVLSVRLDQSASTERLALRIAAEDAENEFDQIRHDELAEQVATLQAGGDEVAAAILWLERSPEGIAALIDAWEAVGHDIRGANPTQAAIATDRAALWLGIPTAEAGTLLPAAWSERIAAELARLAVLLGSMGPMIARIGQARTEAGILARLQPSPELTLARRHEATAERGIYHAFRTIADMNRARGSDRPPQTADRAASVAPAAALPPVLAPALAPNEPTRPPTNPPSRQPATIPPLGSFRAATPDRNRDLFAQFEGTTALNITAARPSQTRTDKRPKTQKR